MAITLDGTTGVTAAAFDGALDAADLTGVMPAMDGSALTNLNAANLTGTLPAIDGSALTNIAGVPTTAGSVGSLAFLLSASNVTQGTNYAGSGLYWASAIGYFSGSHRWEDGTTFSSVSSTLASMGSPSGTWRALGASVAFGAGGPSSKTIFGATLFVRIS